MAPPAGPAQAGKWSYTDDLGQTVTLEKKPTAIAGFVDQIIPLMRYGLTPVAVFGRHDVAADKRFDGLDRTKFATVGISYGEIDLEALAAAKPELIVLAVYPSDTKGTIAKEGPFYGVKDRQQQEQLERIAPVVVIKIGGAGLAVLDSHARLAKALGADPATINAAKKEFNTAAAELKAAAQASPVTVTAAYADKQGLWVTRPQHEPVTQMYSEYGVKFTEVANDGKWYWDIYSWENVGKAKIGDLLLLSDQGLDVAALKQLPTFAKNSSLTAGQVRRWPDATMDYGSQAKYMRELAGWLTQAKKVVG